LIVTGGVLQWKERMARLRYDPDSPIDPEAWLEFDESIRIDAIRDYHQRKRIRLPNDTVHALMHVAVENQVCLGDAYPAKSALMRLISEGLMRHEAVHAVGSVLAEQIFNALKGKNTGTAPNSEYIAKLNQLTARSWKQGSL
jgi:hypothetical protein